MNSKHFYDLVYNSEGLLYRLGLMPGAVPSVINTGFANHHNNDHVLSFDGKQIGISHQSPAENGVSIVYVKVSRSDYQTL